jgi:type II secretory pathway pseudopilin PulG
MVGLLVAIAIMMILSTVAFQAWSDRLRRDNEAEMIFRARDLVRALKKYRADRGGALPTDFDQLKEPGSKGQYFLRQLWKDPLVKGGKWGLLYAAPQGGIVDPNAPGAIEGPPGIGDRSKTQPQSPGSLVGGFQGQSSTREIGGLPIAGVKSLCKEKTFRVLHDESEYSMWLFTVFDPDQYQSALPGIPSGGDRPPGAPGAPAAPGTPGMPPSQRPSSRGGASGGSRRLD